MARLPFLYYIPRAFAGADNNFISRLNQVVELVKLEKNSFKVYLRLMWFMISAADLKVVYKLLNI